MFLTSVLDHRTKHGSNKLDLRKEENSTQLTAALLQAVSPTVLTAFTKIPSALQPQDIVHLLALTWHEHSRRE